MHEITVTTERRTQLIDITRQVREALDGATGAAVLVYVPHTTAGVTINEHVDPMVVARLRDGARADRPRGLGLAAHRRGRGRTRPRTRAPR